MQTLIQVFRSRSALLIRDHLWVFWERLSMIILLEVVMSSAVFIMTVLLNLNVWGCKSNPLHYRRGTFLPSLAQVLEFKEPQFFNIYILLLGRHYISQGCLVYKQDIQNQKYVQSKAISASAHTMCRNMRPMKNYLPAPAMGMERF